MSEKTKNYSLYSYIIIMTAQFLPTDYTAPIKQSNYYKLQDGDNKIRIMSPAIVGYQDREDRKPINTPDRRPSIDVSKPAKHFRAFIVYDYASKSFKCWQVTQGSIREQIENYNTDEDFGNPLGYDLKIKKTGKDLETKYSVTPWKVVDVDKEVQAKFARLEYDLNNLFVNGEVITGTKDDEDLPFWS